jgi:hypothetical protein
VTSEAGTPALVGVARGLALGCVAAGVAAVLAFAPLDAPDPLLLDPLPLLDPPLLLDPPPLLDPLLLVPPPPPVDPPPLVDPPLLVPPLLVLPLFPSPDLSVPEPWFDEASAEDGDVVASPEPPP